MSASVLDGVLLRALTADDLAAIAGWFEDRDTRRFLGGPEWPARMLAHAERAVGTVFRGALQLGAHHYLAIADGTPAGYVDCGTFDRCTVYAARARTGRSSATRSRRSRGRSRSWSTQRSAAAGSVGR
jgi:hypothetical protein